MIYHPIIVNTLWFRFLYRCSYYQKSMSAIYYLLSLSMIFYLSISSPIHLILTKIHSYKNHINKSINPATQYSRHNNTIYLFNQSSYLSYSTISFSMMSILSLPSIIISWSSAVILLSLLVIYILLLSIVNRYFHSWDNATLKKFMTISSSLSWFISSTITSIFIDLSTIYSERCMILHFRFMILNNNIFQYLYYWSSWYLFWNISTNQS